MAATVVNEEAEGNFRMKMQDFGALKSLNCRSFLGALPPWSPQQGSTLDLTGDLGGPQTSHGISPPLTQKPGSAPGITSTRRES